MIRYFLIRILSIVPILWILSLLSFFLSKNVPQDPVLSYLQLNEAMSAQVDLNVEESIDYKNASRKLGLDKPEFYCSILPSSFPRDYSNLSTQKKEKIKKSQSGFILPSFRWHGFDNQYHHWIKKAISFDFGNSFLDGQSVSEKISKAFSWTFLLVLLSMIILIAIAIPLGIYISRDRKFSTSLTWVLYFLYAMPIFWFATLMVVFFTTDDYGSWTNWFPSVGVSFIKTGFIEKLTALLLPVLILCLHSAGYISRQMRSSILDEQSLAYSTTGKAKGLTITTVIRDHNLNNALLPMITVFTSIIPSALAGSLIIEVIFGIPGIGRLLYASINGADWNVVFALLIIIGLVTIISYLIGDLLYSYVNPKIRFGKTQ